jgi:hypothetical protein
MIPDIPEHLNPGYKQHNIKGKVLMFLTTNILLAINRNRVLNTTGFITIYEISFAIVDIQ